MHTPGWPVASLVHVSIVRRLRRGARGRYQPTLRHLDPAGAPSPPSPCGRWLAWGHRRLSLPRRRRSARRAPRTPLSPPRRPTPPRSRCLGRPRPTCHSRASPRRTRSCTYYTRGYSPTPPISTLTRRAFHVRQVARSARRRVSRIDPAGDLPPRRPTPRLDGATIARVRGGREGASPRVRCTAPRRGRRVRRAFALWFHVGRVHPRRRCLARGIRAIPTPEGSTARPKDQHRLVWIQLGAAGPARGGPSGRRGAAPAADAGSPGRGGHCTGAARRRAGGPAC